MKNRRPESPPATDPVESPATAPDLVRDPLDLVRRMQQGGLGAPGGTPDAFRDGVQRERALKQLSELMAAAGGRGAGTGAAQAFQGLPTAQAAWPAPQVLADLLKRLQAGLQHPGQAGALPDGLQLDGPLAGSLEQALRLFEEASRATGHAQGAGAAALGAQAPVEAPAQPGSEGAGLGALMDAARRGDAMALLAALANLAGSPLALAWAATAAPAPEPIDAVAPDAPRQDAGLRGDPAR